MRQRPDLNTGALLRLVSGTTALQFCLIPVSITPIDPDSFQFPH